MAKIKQHNIESDTILYGNLYKIDYLLVYD